MFQSSIKENKKGGQMIAINLFVTWHLQEPMNSQDKADIRAINLLVAWHLQKPMNSQDKTGIC